MQQITVPYFLGQEVDVGGGAERRFLWAILLVHQNAERMGRETGIKQVVFSKLLLPYVLEGSVVQKPHLTCSCCFKMLNKKTVHFLRPSKKKPIISSCLIVTLMI